MINGQDATHDELPMNTTSVGGTRDASGIVAFQAGSSLARSFVEVPFALHSADPNWVPPLRSSALAQLDPSYPWYEKGSACHFVIENLGRVSAFCKDGGEVGYVGSFECVEDQPLASGLLDRAVAWLRQKGVRRIRGPVTFDTWHSYRFAIEGRDRPPFLLEPYQPAYYPALWQRYGFELVSSYVSMRLQNLPEAIARCEPHFSRSSKAGFRLRSFDLGRMEAEISILHRLSVQAFQGALGFESISLEGFGQLYRGSKALLDPGLTVVAEDSSGRPVGFLFGYPDRAGAVRAMRGDSGLLGKARFVLNRTLPRTAVLKTLAVLPEARGTGLALAMTCQHYRHAVAAGYRDGIHALMAEDNASLHLSRFLQAEFLRRYALYELAS